MKHSADRNDQIFGLMYGIQDENVRRKLGYRGRKYGSLKQGRQRNKRNRFRNGRNNYENDRGLIVSSNDGILLPTQKTSFASTKGIFSATDQRGNFIDRVVHYFTYHLMFKQKTKRAKEDRTIPLVLQRKRL